MSTARSAKRKRKRVPAHRGDARRHRREPHGVEVHNRDAGVAPGAESLLAEPRRERPVAAGDVDDLEPTRFACAAGLDGPRVVGDERGESPLGEAVAAEPAVDGVEEPIGLGDFVRRSLAGVHPLDPLGPPAPERPDDQGPPTSPRATLSTGFPSQRSPRMAAIPYRALHGSNQSAGTITTSRSRCVHVEGSQRGG